MLARQGADDLELGIERRFLGCFRRMMSAVRGGGRGILAGAIPAAAGPFINKLEFGSGLVASSVLGGLGSVAGGGKFANGASTGAFGYLYNKCGGSCRWTAFKDAASMTYDWALGKGPADLNFGPGSVQVSDMEDAPGVNAARSLFYNNNAESTATSGTLQPVQNFAATFGIWDLMTSSSPTQQFVGSYRASGSNLEFTITNTSSLQSALYGFPISWERTFIGPAGNMRQTYQWSEPIKGRAQWK